MDKKKILIFANYYYPDVASVAQLLKDQAEGMLNDFNVTVITAVPCYEGVIDEKYKSHRYYYENINGVRVIRVRVPEFKKSDKISRIKNIITYFINSIGATVKSGKQDYVFTISQPPILGGLLGVIGKWIKHAKMIYCIQDFNPEQIMAVGYSNNNLLLKFLMFIDKFCCRRSNLVITVGRDLVETLKQRFNNKNVPKHIMINNWIDEKQIYPLDIMDKGVQEFKAKYGLLDKYVIMYSGNLGLFYDLINLLKVIEKFKPKTKTSDGREVVFAFVGAGAVMEDMKLYVKEHNMNNVVFIPYQSKDRLIYSLNAADVHWCVNAKGIKGVSCPSKFYSLIACNKPILGVLEKNSEIRLLIEEIGCGLVCEPEDYNVIEKNIQWLIDNADNGKVQALGSTGRKYLEKNLSKNKSINKYIDTIKAI